MARKKVEADQIEQPAPAGKDGWWTLNVTSPSVTFSNIAIVRLELEPMPFAGFVECLRKKQIAMAAADAENGGDKFFFREQLKRYLKGYDADGKAHRPGDMDILSLHPRIGFALKQARWNGETKPGEIIQKGDGISSPILFRFGSPVIAGQSKEGPLVIEEIEFQAQTYGAVEDVLFAESRTEMAFELLRTCGRPVTPPGAPKLLVLPDTALQSVRQADGFMIVEQIVPRFLELDAA